MARPRPLDLVIAAGFVVWAVIEIVTGAVHGPLAITLPVAVVAPGALAWRRVAPGPAALVCAAGPVLKTAAGMQLDGLALLATLLVAAYSVGRQLPPRRAGLVVAAIVVLAWISLLGLPAQDQTAANYPFIGLWVCAPAVAGAALRMQIDRATVAADRAARAEMAREQYAQAAVLDERLRLARELHDTVAHAVSVMVLNAGAVRSRLPSELAPEREALEHTEAHGRQAIGELRRMLGVLRSTGEVSDVESAPTLAQIDGLLDDMRHAGVVVDFRVDGAATALDAGLELCAYRVVQEALTNIRKHADAATAMVRLSYEPSILRIRVSDDGHGTGTGSDTGYGLVGIRERVELYGGTLAVDSPVAGGFTLHAELPVIAA